MDKAVNRFIDKMLGIEDKGASFEKEIPLVPLSSVGDAGDNSTIEFSLNEPKVESKVKIDFVKEPEKEEEFLVSANKSRNMAKRRRLDG